MTVFKNAKLVGPDYDPAKYHKQDAARGTHAFAMGRSSLMDFMACPHRWFAGFESEDTNATDWGQLIDTLVLSPKEFETRFAVRPDTYPDSKTGEEKPWAPQAKYCREWKADAKASGRIVIRRNPEVDDEGDVIEAGASKPSLAEGKRAVEILMADPRVAEFVRCSSKQVYITAEYHDKWTGLVIPVKTLIDFVPSDQSERYGKCLGDLKTARDADPRKWGYVVDDRNYHVQAAMSLDLYAAAVPESDRTEFYHVIQENEPPYEVGRRFISQEFIDLGRTLYQSALHRYAVCLKSGFWPSYDDEGDNIIDGWQAVQPSARASDRAMRSLGSFTEPVPASAENAETGEVTP